MGDMSSVPLSPTRLQPPPPPFTCTLLFQLETVRGKGHVWVMGRHDRTQLPHHTTRHPPQKTMPPTDLPQQAQVVLYPAPLSKLQPCQSYSGRTDRINSVPNLTRYKMKCNCI